MVYGKWPSLGKIPLARYNVIISLYSPISSRFYSSVSVELRVFEGLNALQSCSDKCQASDANGIFVILNQLAKNMHPLFRAFKRHYHKVTKVYSHISDGTPFKLQIKFENDILKAGNTTPDETETVRFIVLMGQFLSLSSPIYYRAVWNILREQFVEELSDKTISDVESAIERMNKGHIAIRVNDDNLTAEKIYQILSDGECFARYEEPQNYLNSLKDIPVIGQLFWYQFHDYTLQGLALISGLFDIVLQIEQIKKYQKLYPVLNVTAKQCIYCLETTGTFNSEEHIFPESLGNDELILPKGYVCDECNNGILAILDNYLLKFEPVAFLQVYFVPYTKQGKLPEANFQNMIIKKTHPLHIKVVAKDKTGNPKNEKNVGDGWQSFNLQMRGKTFDPKQLARALYKIALGMVAFDKGLEQACDSKYNAARELILNNQNFPNNLLMCTEGQPKPQVQVTAHHNMPDGTPSAISIYGLIFMLNLESYPVLALTEELNQLKFASYPLFN